MQKGQMKGKKGARGVNIGAWQKGRGKYFRFREGGGGEIS
jgi:hypothetical protein